jgi:hypothetical protein
MDLDHSMQTNIDALATGIIAGVLAAAVPGAGAFDRG